MNQKAVKRAILTIQDAKSHDEAIEKLIWARCSVFLVSEKYSSIVLNSTADN